MLVAVVAVSAPAAAALPSAGADTASALRLSAHRGHGQKVSRAASAPGGPVVPEGCRNFGHWVSSEAHVTTCEDSPRPGRGQERRRDR